MAKARYYKADGSEGGSRELPGALFDGVVNQDVLHQAVKAYLANQRQGTAAAKNRSAVRGGSRKPWRQKGTGRARQGSIRAVQWTGGGRAFPPVPHSWRQKLPRRVKALARRSAFNARAGDDRIVVAELPRLDAPRTREMRQFLEALEAAEGRALILTDGIRPTLHLSVRNLPGVEILPFGQESVYDLLQADTVIVEASALDGIGDDPPARSGRQAAVASGGESGAGVEVEAPSDRGAEAEGTPAPEAAEESEGEESTDGPEDATAVADVEGAAGDPGEPEEAPAAQDEDEEEKSDA